jgi:hypothetical protein
MSLRTSVLQRVKQSPIKRDNLIDEGLPFKRRLLRNACPELVEGNARNDISI